MNSTPENTRLLVGLSGIAASGKSTLAALIVAHTNALLEEAEAQRDRAILVGLDGWHLTRAQLDAFPDPKLAHDRRGAHWTFDGMAYVEFVKALRLPLQPESEGDANATAQVIVAPSFDHAVKDPTPASMSISPHHRIVLIEGLYTFLSIMPWSEAGAMLDERWFIDVGIDVASHRLVKRHVVSGVARDMQEAVWRAEESDIPSTCLCSRV